MKNKIHTFLDMLQNSGKTVITTHQNPDGDAIGSVTALYRFISNLRKRNGQAMPVILLPGVPADNMKYLYDGLNVLTWGLSETEDTGISDCISSADLTICCDMNSVGRAGKLEDMLRGAQCRRILIDHHPSPAEDEFEILFSEPDRSSTCELMYSIMKECAGTTGEDGLIDMECARSIATGIITDTNNFSNSTSARTFRIAADLTEMGISLENIKSIAFGGYSENRMRLLGELLSHQMKIIPGTCAAYFIMSKELQRQFDYRTGDTEGVVNMPLNIKGIRLSAFFTESDENIRVSIRTVAPVSANEFSRRYFGGGGHERAAGGRCQMTLEELEKYFRASVTEYLEDTGL